MREHTNQISFDRGTQDAHPQTSNTSLDVWWPALVIALGVLFVIVICSWNPRV